MCVLLFVRSFVLYAFMCVCFWLCVLFPVVVFLFYAFVFAMFEDCLTDSRGHLKETCNMFQDVSEWFSGDADSFGMRWVCASRDGSFIGGLEILNRFRELLVLFTILKWPLPNRLSRLRNLQGFPGLFRTEGHMGALHGPAGSCIILLSWVLCLVLFLFLCFVVLVSC